MTTRECLIEVRAILADPAHWTQGISALTADGDGTYPGEKDAVAFCLTGAMSRVVSPTWSEWEALRCALLALVTAPSLVGWNDAETRTHAEVLALLDLAITMEATP